PEQRRDGLTHLYGVTRSPTEVSESLFFSVGTISEHTRFLTGERTDSVFVGVSSGDNVAFDIAQLGVGLVHGSLDILLGTAGLPECVDTELDGSWQKVIDARFAFRWWCVFVHALSWSVSSCSRRSSSSSMFRASTLRPSRIGCRSLSSVIDRLPPRTALLVRR